MSNYEICFRKSDGHITLKYDVPCSDDLHAKVMAHALMSREYDKFDVWQGERLVYERPGRFRSQQVG